MDVRALIEKHEDRIPYAYTDSLGYLTIGVGHLIDKRMGGRLPDAMIDQLLDYDILAKTAELRTALPWAEDLDVVRHAVLVDMAFNLGVSGLCKFQHFLASLQAGHYDQASQEMLQSLWAAQVKTRATRLSGMIKTGLWPTV